MCLPHATCSLHQGSGSETETHRHHRSQLSSDLRTPQGTPSIYRLLNQLFSSIMWTSTHLSVKSITLKQVAFQKKACVLLQADKLHCYVKAMSLSYRYDYLSVKGRSVHHHQPVKAQPVFTEQRWGNIFLLTRLY